MDAGLEQELRGGEESLIVLVAGGWFSSSFESLCFSPSLLAYIFLFGM